MFHSPLSLLLKLCLVTSLEWKAFILSFNVWHSISKITSFLFDVICSTVGRTAWNPQVIKSDFYDHWMSFSKSDKKDTLRDVGDWIILSLPLPIHCINTQIIFKWRTSTMNHYSNQPLKVLFSHMPTFTNRGNNNKHHHHAPIY
jgi:hypothetical protein